MSFRIVYPFMSSMLDLLFFCRCFLLYAGLDILRKFLKYSQGEESKVQYTKDNSFLSETKIPGFGHLLSPPSIFFNCSSFHLQLNVLLLSITSQLWVHGHNFILIFFQTSPWYKYTFQQGSMKSYGYSSVEKFRSTLPEVFSRKVFLKYLWENTLERALI